MGWVYLPLDVEGPEVIGSIWPNGIIFHQPIDFPEIFRGPFTFQKATWNGLKWGFPFLSYMKWGPRSCEGPAISFDQINGLDISPILINGVFLGVINPLILTIDPNFQRDIQVVGGFSPPIWTICAPSNWIVSPGIGVNIKQNFETTNQKKNTLKIAIVSSPKMGPI